MLLLALVLPFRTAAAHPRLVRSQPTAGSHVQTVPRELSVTFNEELSTALSWLKLFDARQQLMALDSLRAVPGDAGTLTARILGPLSPGEYTVKWQAGGADGHPMRGEYTFVVDAGTGGPTTGSTTLPAPDVTVASPETAATPATRPQTPADPAFGVESPAYVVIRAIQSIALVGLLGILALRLIVLPRFVRLANTSGAATAKAVEQAAPVWAAAALWMLGVVTAARVIAQHAVVFGFGEPWTRSSLSALLLHSGWLGARLVVGAGRDGHRALGCAASSPDAGTRVDSPHGSHARTGRECCHVEPRRGGHDARHDRPRVACTRGRRLDRQFGGADAGCGASHAAVGRR